MKSVRLYEFGSFRLNVAEGKLFCDGKAVPLTPKAFETLLVLVRQRGQLVDKDTLIAEVWRDSFVEEGSLTRNISVLRKALGDNQTVARYIETLPKRGYRFIASVKEVADENTNGKKTVAVLPFKIIGGGDEQKYLSLGMADTLITRLSNIRQLIVRPTRAVQKYAEDCDPVEAGRELQVEAVLDGSIMQAGERLRVTVQFISVAETETLWGEKFDEKLTDIFDVQDSIAERVAEAMLLKLTNAEQKRLTEPTTRNAEAYRQYLMGRYFWNKRTSASVLKAVECFRRSIAEDPAFPLAHLGLAECYLIFSQHHLGKPHESIPLAKAAAEKALQLDASLSEAYTTLAHANFLYDWDWQAASDNHLKALHLKPNYAHGRHWYGVYLAGMGRFDEGLAEIKQAQFLDPLSPIISKSIATVLGYAGRHAEAEAQYKRTLEIDHNFTPALTGLGLSYCLTKRHREAIAFLERAVDISGRDPMTLACLNQGYAAAGQAVKARWLLQELIDLFKQNYVSPFDIALVYIELKEFDKAFEWLEKSVEMRDAYTAYIKVYPDLSPLRGDSRFAAILKRMNVVP